MGETSAERGLRFVVYGRVQGVSFRWHTVEVARELGLAGWVRNRPDGTVEVHAEGPPELLDRLAAWLAHGPGRARVTRLERREVEPEPGLAGFSIRR